MRSNTRGLLKQRGLLRFRGLFASWGMDRLFDLTPWLTLCDTPRTPARTTEE